MFSNPKIQNSFFRNSMHEKKKPTLPNRLNDHPSYFIGRKKRGSSIQRKIRIEFFILAPKSDIMISTKFLKITIFRKQLEKLVLWIVRYENNHSVEHDVREIPQ